MPDDVAVLILTFNCVGIIERTVRAARQVSTTIIAVDSGSTDGTLEILRQLGCEVHERPFKHYADQRNWAIETIGDRYPWQLHLDADEVLDGEVIGAVKVALRDPRGHDGFLFHRRTYFLGKLLTFGGATNWHMRLFRSGRGRCEDRLYDQHFLCSGSVAVLPGWLDDMNVGSLTEWTARHNRWSGMEAQEILRPTDQAGKLEARLGRDPRQRRRVYKGAYYNAPPYLRAWLLFFYRYFIQLGFLDGRAGFLYAFFQALWFRMLVDAKLYEACAPSRPGFETERQSQRPAT
jgi:glycosyltransferase involved in cell wall biosynthesis